MKKQIIIIFLISTCFHSKAQVIEKGDLTNFSWFTDYSNKSFYKSDTLSIIRITNQFPQNQELNRQYIELDYNNDSNITRLNFKKNNVLDIIDVDVKSWTETKTKKQWKWKFDLKQQLISFYFDGKLHSTFVIKEKMNDTLIWKYTNGDNSSGDETYNLLIYKLVRVK